MKPFHALFILLLFPILMTADAANEPLSDLHPLEWSNRILLIFPGEENQQTLIKEFRKQEASIDDRHLIWFIVTSGSVKTNYPHPLANNFNHTVIKHYAEAASSSEVVLIGKDGGVKYRHGTLDLAAVFERIDSMPMRQAEMRRK